MDSGNLFLSLFVSTVGFGYFIYGRKQAQYAFMLAGAVLMFYGYFVESFWLSAGIGALLMAAPFFVR